MSESDKESIKKFEEVIEHITKRVIHKLGVGFSEYVYHKAIALELRNRGYKVQNEVNREILYDNNCSIGTIRMDILVDDKYILEIKRISQLTNKEINQVIGYLNVTGLDRGYLININIKSYSIAAITRMGK